MAVEKEMQMVAWKVVCLVAWMVAQTVELMASW